MTKQAHNRLAPQIHHRARRTAMLRVFQYEISNGVLTLEAFRGGGTAANGAALWPQTGHHGGFVVLEGWVVVNLSLEMLGFHTHLLQKPEIFRIDS
nr:hypothetical protein CFP56_46004 [Quercus suber]